MCLKSSGGQPTDGTWAPKPNGESKVILLPRFEAVSYCLIVYTSSDKISSTLRQHVASPFREGARFLKSNIFHVVLNSENKNTKKRQKLFLPTCGNFWITYF